MQLSEKQYGSCSDAELMNFIEMGKTAAFEQLYYRYSKNLHYFFYRMLNDASVADDFLQELFLKIIEKPYLFDKNRKFSTWIYALAVNMCKNEYRRKNIRNQKQYEQNSNELLFEDEKYSSEFDHILFSSRLNEALDVIGEHHKTTFILRYQEDLTVKEIAGIMKCSEGTVKSRIFYATKKLSEKLKIFSPLQT